MFPPGTVINIKTDYGAQGDGLTDDTPVILRAIRDNIAELSPGPIIYFPAGVYLVSDRLPWRDAGGVWRATLTFQGEGRDSTVIKLRDSTPGFTDPTRPKAVIFTASTAGDNPTAAGKDWLNLGEGNTAFRNFIMDLTVDTGSGNPGAIGIDYLASNIGAVRNVKIRSGDGQGVCGLAMFRKWPGPCLIKNVEIEGFDYGIVVSQVHYSVTFEHIALSRQNIAGIRNNGNVLSIRDLTSLNSVPAVQNVNNLGLIVLLDSTLTMGAPSVSAIENDTGELFARNIMTTGYQWAIRDLGTVLPGASISEFVSGPIQSLFPSPQRSLGLSVKETPELPRESLSDSVSVADFGAIPDDSTRDSLPAFQAAIDSGALAVYVPSRGHYVFSDTLVYRANVRRLDFIGSHMVKSRTFPAGKPLIRTEPGTQPVVLVERIRSASIEHASGSTLVVRDGGGDCWNVPGSGPVFLEDVGGHFDFQGISAWGRQLNPEGDAAPEGYLKNNGGTFWVMGLKTERLATVIKTVGGGKTELLGGFLFPVDPVPTDLPAFINEESSHSLVYASYGFQPGTDYHIHVRETRNGETRELLKEAMIPRGIASMVPLYTGYRQGAGGPGPGGGGGGRIGLGLFMGVLVAGAVVVITVASKRNR